MIFLVFITVCLLLAASCCLPSQPDFGEFWFHDRFGICRNAMTRNVTITLLHDPPISHFVSVLTPGLLSRK